MFVPSVFFVQILMIFYDKTETAMNFKFGMQEFGIILYFTFFFKNDLRTLESPHGTLLQRRALNLLLAIVVILSVTSCEVKQRILPSVQQQKLQTWIADHQMTSW